MYRSLDVNTQSKFIKTSLVDRPKGPPTIEDMTSRESFFEGGGQCTVKGKNLKGKEPTKVSFYSESGWSSDAHVNGRFTSVSFS